MPIALTHAFAVKTGVVVIVVAIALVLLVLLVTASMRGRARGDQLVCGAWAPGPGGVWVHGAGNVEYGSHDLP